MQTPKYRKVPEFQKKLKKKMLKINKYIFNLHFMAYIYIFSSLYFSFFFLRTVLGSGSLLNRAKVHSPEESGCLETRGSLTSLVF